MNTQENNPHQASTGVEEADEWSNVEVREAIAYRDGFKAGASFQAGKPTKTLEECKDEVAQSYGYKDWDELYKNQDNNNSVINQVASLYATSQLQVRETEWREVSKELPEIGQEVWLFTDYGDKGAIEIAVWTKEIERWYDMNGITHWMPANKPQPPITKS